MLSPQIYIDYTSHKVSSLVIAGTKKGKTRVKRGKTLHTETGLEKAKTKAKKGARKSGGMTEKK